MTDAASKFASAPLYMKGDLVAAFYAEVEMRSASIATTSDIGELLGRIDPADMLVVEPGNWLIHTVTRFTDPSVVSDATFRASFLAFPAADEFHVERGRRDKALVVKGKVHVENDFEVRDAKDFLSHHARIGSDGRVITHGSMPLSVQVAAVLLAGEAGAGHLAELKKWREWLGTDFNLSNEARSDINGFDLAVSGGHDRVSNGMAAINAAVPPNGADVEIDAEGNASLSVTSGSLLETLCSVTGLPPYRFSEVRHSPFYTMEATRAIARRLLSPFLGDFPMEDAVLLGLAPRVCGKLHNPLESWACEGDLVEEAPGVLGIPEMPDYVTSDFRLYRRDDVMALFFEDTMGAYCYTWPAPPSPTMQP
jgi:hypothetical protein